MDTLDVIVLGGGIVGLSAAAHLRKAGLRFRVVERAYEVGGTWRDHDYPGCGADTEASTYVPSFEPLYSKRRFATRQELFDYCKLIAAKHVGYEHILLNHTVLGAEFVSETNRWKVSTDHGELSAQYVIWATFSGADVTKVKRPLFPDQDRFQGMLKHSTELGSDLDFFKGKKVTLVGCGATAIQMVPTIYPVVKELNILSRTVPYVKKCDLGEGPTTRFGYRLQGALLRCRNEMISFFDNHAKLEFLYRWPYRFHEYTLKRGKLPAAAIPPFAQPVQCTRRGFDYLGFRDTLSKPGVNFIDLKQGTGIEGYYENGLIAHGRRIESDVVILSTGYHMAELNFSIKVDGRPFHSAADKMMGMYGVIDGLPNSLLTVFGSPVWIIPPRLAEFNTKVFIRLIHHMKKKGHERADINVPTASKTMALVHRLNKGHIVLSRACTSYRYLLSNTGQEKAHRLPAKTPANLPYVPFPSVVMELLTRLTFSFKHFDFDSPAAAKRDEPGDLKAEDSYASS
ncbi:flavin-containing monooxygenase [Caldimonas brevitalea]|uniref:Cyclohexanone monooxygenase n=1 Tax=Caldimonas brevitalea TaxID=413882 RepID=A0A0G3BM20_9BURK|nr:NAD(P)/FAD-dependent oxidoreductase [Caldimonas brevitalea]AKJ29038.1 cyclohexanone monooxygenase [Caldimonas brevitalea]